MHPGRSLTWRTGCAIRHAFDTSADRLLEHEDAVGADRVGDQVRGFGGRPTAQRRDPDGVGTMWAGIITQAAGGYAGMHTCPGPTSPGRLIQASRETP